MNSFSLMYRSFFDMQLVSSFVKENKAVGLKALFVLSLILSLLTAIFSYIALIFLSYQDIKPFVQNLPEIRLEDGQIVAPENYEKKFINKKNVLFFVFDTTGRPVSLQGLPSRGIYITRNEIITYRGYETRIISFKGFAGSDVVINPETLETAFNRTVSFLRIYMPFLLFILLVPSAFFFYSAIVFLFTLISYIYSFFFKQEMTFDQRVRISVISLLPIFILNAAASFAGASISFWIALLLPLTYMFCYFQKFSALQKQTES